jgi:predicted XRE-type DNA-binding protein
MLTEGVAPVIYNVTAVQWRKGWELHIDGEGVTQCRTLGQAVQQVRDYLETMHGGDFSDARINLRFDIDGLEDVVTGIRDRMKQAAEMQAQSAKDLREVTKALRRHGLSVTDTAEVLGVSRGRVSQLVS